MNRDQARAAFMAGRQSAAYGTIGRDVDEDFETWYTKETLDEMHFDTYSALFSLKPMDCDAWEIGCAVRCVDAETIEPTKHSDPNKIGVLIGFTGDEPLGHVRVETKRLWQTAPDTRTRHEHVALPLPIPPEALQVHDEILLKAPVATSCDFPLVFASWRCRDRACPERPAVSAPTAPTCYTCGRPMCEAKREKDVPQLIDDINRRVASLMAMPSKLLDSLRLPAPEPIKMRMRYYGDSPLKGVLAILRQQSILQGII